METKYKVAFGIGGVLLAYVFLFLGTSIVLNFGAKSSRQLYALNTDGKSLWVFVAGSTKSPTRYIDQREIDIDGKPIQAGLNGNYFEIRMQGQTYKCEMNASRLVAWSPTKSEVFFIKSDKPKDRVKRIWKWTLAEGYHPISEPIRDIFFLAVSLDGNHVTVLKNRIDEKLNNQMLVFDTSGRLESTMDLKKINSRGIMVSDHRFLLSPRNTVSYQRKYPATQWVYDYDSVKSDQGVFRVEGRDVKDVVDFGGEVWVLFQEPHYTMNPLYVRRDPDTISVAKLSTNLKRVKREIVIPASELPN